MSEWALVSPDNTKLELTGNNTNTTQVPDVRGMGLRDALYILENKGLKVKMQGVGRIKQQSITPGTKVNGQTIELTMG